MSASKITEVASSDSSSEEEVVVPVAPAPKPKKASKKSKAVAEPAKELNPNEPRTITLVEAINSMPVFRNRKQVICPDLNIKELIDMYEKQDEKKWKALYIFPMLIDYSASDQDRGGKMSLRGLGVYEAFALISESEIATRFPSVAAMTHWKKFFACIFDGSEEGKKQYGTDRIYPVYNVAGDAVVQMGIADMCRRDFLEALGEEAPVKK
jgi:hypothetical protein